MLPLSILLALALAVASISFTVTETKLFKPYREWATKKAPIFGSLFSCGYCFGHWVAALLVVIYRPRLFNFYWLLDYIITGLVIAWLAGLQWVAMCWLVQKTGK